MHLCCFCLLACSLTILSDGRSWAETTDGRLSRSDCTSDTVYVFPIANIIPQPNCPAAYISWMLSHFCTRRRNCYSGGKKHEALRLGLPYSVVAERTGYAESMQCDLAISARIIDHCSTSPYCAKSERQIFETFDGVRAPATYTTECSAG